MAKLTKKQAEVVRMVWDGFSYKEIASRLAISVQTVENTLLNARIQVESRSMYGLMQWALEHDVIARKRSSMERR